MACNGPLQVRGLDRPPRERRFPRKQFRSPAEFTKTRQVEPILCSTPATQSARDAWVADRRAGGGGGCRFGGAALGASGGAAISQDEARTRETEAFRDYNVHRIRGVPDCRGPREILPLADRSVCRRRVA